MAGTLQAAPDGESDRSSSLRRELVDLANTLAEQWLHERRPVDSQRIFHYHKAVWKLREFATELGRKPSAVVEPTGIRVVLDAFCSEFTPDTLLALQPATLASIVVRDHLGVLRERMTELGIELTKAVAGASSHFLVARYPQGEQNNVLMACCALPYFHLPRSSHMFATSAAGPAYFFATAAEIQNSKGFSDGYDPPRLCFIGELLEISGWLEHPRIGPLIDGWRDHFGFGPGYLDRTVLSAEILNRMREAQDEYRAALPAYTPDDFDRHVPAMWDRLREALAPTATTAAPDVRDRPAGVIDVLNAGWSFAQLYLSELYEILGSSSARERYDARVLLNRLLAEGIERIS